MKSKYLITGGAGSLGKALIKTLKKDNNNELFVYSRDEGKHALIYGNDNRVKTFIGDVKDRERLDEVINLVKPDYIIHTAALKRIDDIELSPKEAIKTNILGSRNVAETAVKHNVEKCILISTDKSCKNVNCYGATKFIAERLFTNYNYQSTSTVLSSCRYGNVIASRGSFIPLWLGLIKENKKIQITSLKCSRFLFTLYDAVNTVLESLDRSEGGEVFIPNISSFKMETILEAVKSISGVDDIDYEIIGMRPGEKLHEDMLADVEIPYTYHASDNLLAVLPQYGDIDYSYEEQYNGREMNSSLHTNDDVEFLTKLIKRGIRETE